MITKKYHSPWPGDMLIEDLSIAGLHTPRIVHAHRVRLQRHRTKGIAELAYLEYLQADS